MFKIFLTIIYVLFSVFAFSQKVINIDEININSCRTTLYNFANGETTDSLIKKQNNTAGIDELLSILSPIFVKSYGNGLASITLRGSSANHTSVNWNGFPVNSLTTGDADLSLFQSAFFENIKIISGASASLFGSGTFGGAVELNNEKNHKRGFSANISSEIGSFNSQKYFLNFNIAKKNWQYKFAINKLSAENDFSYIDDKIVKYRKHNAEKSFGIMQNLFIELARKNNIDIGFWYFKKNIEIPEIIGSYGISSKLQNDKSFKIFLRQKKIYNKSRISFGSAFFNDYLHYTDKINPEDMEFYINSEIKGKKIIGDFSYRYFFSDKLNFELGNILNYLQANVDNYGKEKSELNFGIFAAGRLEIKNFISKISFRTEFSEFIKPQYLFSFGLQFPSFAKKINYKINISNKFRRPTFNEKYWIPGGNSNILPEKGISGDLVLNIKLLNKQRNKLKINISAYYYKINNMIQWIFVDGIWSAGNNKSVLSRGIESRIKYNFNMKKLKFQIISSYNFTLSTLEKVFNNTENLLGKQLVYVPKHSSKTNINISYKKINTAFFWSFTGLRFTTGDNIPEFALPPFNTFNFYSFYNFNLKKYNISTGFKITNIFNNSREIIKSYPVQGRAFYFSINIQTSGLFSKNNEK